MRDLPPAAPRAAAVEDAGGGAAAFASDISFSLQQRPRRIPSRYLYDALGSSLFEAICHLPWYPIWRAELALLRGSGEEIQAALGRISRLVELGCGSGEKLAELAAALRPRPLEAVLVDVSVPALLGARARLAAIPGLHVVAVNATYETGLLRVAAARPAGRSAAVFFGSNIGNFDPPDATSLLARLRGALAEGDFLFLGADLVKPEKQLLLAYDDPLGVTAAFNKNLLARVNRELGGNFRLDRFAHRAVWNGAESRIEMHLVSLGAQSVAVSAAGLEFSLADGESIWTESSYKYSREEVARLVEPAGFTLRRQWVHAGSLFSLNLFQAA